MEFYWTEQRPDMHKDRRAWEKTWQVDFDRNYRALAVLPGSVVTLMPPSTVEYLNTDGNLMAVEQENMLLCELQRDLATEAAKQFARHDFEKRWTALPRAKREEFVLEGIYRTLVIPFRDIQRQWCPDSTLSNLASRNGEEFLRIIKCLMPDNMGARIVVPIQVPHPIVDRLFTPRPAELQRPEIKAVFRTFRTYRTCVLTYVVWNTLLAYLGRVEHVMPMKMPMAGAERRLADEDMPREMTKQAHDVRKDLAYACQSCRKMEFMLLEGKKLLECSKCRKMGRKVLYCSRECQVKDWKDGVPRPHKAICGKPLSEVLSNPSRAAAQDESPKWIPEADKNYKRSPALLHQLALLSREFADYMLIEPHLDRHNTLSFGGDDMEDKIRFLVQRNRAFRNGSQQAVNAMYAFLAPALEHDGVSRVAVRKQLELEFGVSIDEDVSVDAAKALRGTDEEIRFAVDGLRHHAEHVKQMASGQHAASRHRSVIYYTADGKAHSTTRDA